MHGYICVATGRTSEPPKQQLSQHISVERDSNSVTLSSTDFGVRWDDGQKSWTVGWVWQGGVEPTHMPGSGVAEYSRKKLSAEQERQYQQEVQSWINNGWRVPHELSCHGRPGATLPFMAARQGHKPSTPVRPCLDYRRLHESILSHPGADAPACNQKIQEWTCLGVLGIKKAYRQVHVDPSQV